MIGELLLLSCLSTLVAAQTCGTTLHPMNSLRNGRNVLIPIGAPCKAEVCVENNNMIPWTVYFAFCEDLQPIDNAANCDGAAICQVWKSSGSGSYWFSTSIGTRESVRWSDTFNGVIMRGSGGGDYLGVKRNFVLTILCPQDGISELFPILMDINEQTMTYSFTWHHHSACVGTTKPGMTTVTGASPTLPPEVPPGLDGGWVMIILILVFLVLYCGGGAAFLYVQRGARGADLIPNKAFWAEIPNLVKDGCNFTLAKINEKRTGNAAGNFSTIR